MFLLSSKVGQEKSEVLGLALGEEILFEFKVTEAKNKGSEVQGPGKEQSHPNFFPGVTVLMCAGPASLGSLQPEGREDRAGGRGMQLRFQCQLSSRNR
jgi:hypothetical protein